MTRRIVAGLLVGMLLALGVSSTAAADPAGPTDYLSEITSIEPATDSIRVDVLGGDSFVQLEVDPATEAIVIGYRGEQYLWFQDDGTVLENQNAPSTYTNDDRFGAGTPPANATPDAEPDWVEVASNGRYSWHDHRAHWMQSNRPAGAGVGDQIVEGVIPLLVDGDEVDVTVISTWQPAASRFPAWLGAVGAVGLAVAGALMWRAGRRWTALALPLAAIAAVAGLWQYVSLPSETGPRFVWWLLPAIALGAALVAVGTELRGSSFVARAAALVAGVQLLIWGLIKRDGLDAALIPTDAPGWFDRLATAGALIGGLAFALLALWTLFGGSRSVSDTKRDVISGSRAQSG